MPIRNLCYVGALSTLTMLGSTAVVAQESNNAGERLVDQIIVDVIGRTVDGAAPADLPDETQRELRKLHQERDRKIGKLEQELERKLSKAEAEFRREASREKKPGTVAKKRANLQEKVDRAYNKFEAKLDNENARYDRKRSGILGIH